MGVGKSGGSGEPSWRYRRIMAFGIVGFCFILVPSLGVMPSIPDTRINSEIVSGCFWLVGIVFMLYGGYSTAQDAVAMIVAKTGRPYADPTPSVNTVETRTETKSVVAAPTVSGDPATDKILGVDPEPPPGQGPQ